MKGVITMNLINEYTITFIIQFISNLTAGLIIYYLTNNK